MKILGIETTCDETAAAVVEDGTKLLSNVVASQVDIHAEFGGVVPEVAARSHLEVMLPIIQKALDEAGCTMSHIDGIAVAHGPGLVGSLLIGTLTARTLAKLYNKPLYPINHVEAHTYANFLNGSQPKFPLLSLIVSGGHTQLVLFEDHGNYRVLGRTHDDSVGEAFDKVAKILGLPYPGGPSVSKAAEHGDPKAFALPKPQLGKDSLDFSFSGLKTAVLRAAQSACGKDFRTPSYELSGLLTDQQKNDLAASFQYTAIEILYQRVMAAVERYQPEAMVIGGGVAANKALRDRLAAVPNLMEYAPMHLCTDNAAMIAGLGYFASQIHEPTDPAEVRANPVLSM